MTKSSQSWLKHYLQRKLANQTPKPMPMPKLPVKS